MRRRTVLAGAGAFALAPRAAAAAPLREAFDRVEAALHDPPAMGPWPIPDASEDAAARRFGAPARALAILRATPLGELSASERLEVETVEGGLAREAALAAALPFGAAPGRPFAIDMRTGAWRLAEAGLGAAATNETRDGYLDAVSRLARALDAETRRTRAAAQAGVRLPAALARPLAAAVARTAARPADGSPLVARAPAAVRAAIGAAVERELAPALARQAELLRALAADAPEAWGLGRLPKGDAIYALAIRAGAGVDLTPGQAEAQALAAVQGLSSELDAALVAEGLTRGSLGQRLRALAATGLYPDDEGGRERAVADMNATVAAARAALPRVIAEPVGTAVVRRMAPADEAAARAGYREVTTAGGAYIVDLHAIRARPAWTLPTVALHEALPGHLLQLPLQAQLRIHPLRARYATGYAEGWAVYAETLGDELGLLRGRDRVGYLQSMLFRLSRAIADAGLHLHGWSPARAKAELAALYGGPLFNSLDLEVERLVLAPGAGGADALARLALLRLRRAWRGDARAFHTAVLAHGPWPTRLLGDAVGMRAEAAPT